MGLLKEIVQRISDRRRETLVSDPRYKQLEKLVTENPDGFVKVELTGNVWGNVEDFSGTVYRSSMEPKDLGISSGGIAGPLNLQALGKIKLPQKE